MRFLAIMIDRFSTNFMKGFPITPSFSPFLSLYDFFCLASTDITAVLGELSYKLTDV